MKLLITLALVEDSEECAMPDQCDRQQVSRARAITPLMLAASVSWAATAAAQGPGPVAPGMPPDNSATAYEWLPSDAAEEPRVSEPEPLKPIVREGWVILPFIGGTFAGWGSMKAERDCRSGLCESSTAEHTYHQNLNPLVGLNGLYHLLPKLRAGLGLAWIPVATFDIEDVSSNWYVGSELAPALIVEGIFGEKHAGAVRGFVGANLLFPQRDLLSVIDRSEAECRSVRDEGGSCDVASGPYTGFSGGVAGAYVARVSDIGAVRVELSLEYVRFAGPSTETSAGFGTEYVDRLDWSGTRLSWRLGLEL